jgi:replicative DNA helicase
VTDTERTLPHNLDAERSVLGAALVDTSAWPKIAAVLCDKDFFRDAHQRIFRALGRLVIAGMVADPLLLKDELIRGGDLDECGGPAYIAGLSNGVPRSTNVTYYARVVKSHATLRAVIETASKVVASAYNLDDSAMVLDNGVAQLLALSGVAESEVVTIGAATRDWITGFESEQGLGIPTGFADLDEILGGGIRPKQLVMLAARPGMGKTTLLMNVAEHVAHAGVPAGIFTLEMDPMALAEGSIARTAQIDSHRMRAKLLGQKDWARVSYAIEQLHDAKLYLVQRATTLTQIEAWCRRLQSEHGVRFFGLDYIQRMGDPHTRDRRLEIDYISRGLQRIATELDVAFVVLSQLTRASEHRTDKRPQLSDLKESGGLEADADVVLLIFRPDAYDTDPNNEDAGIAEIIVAKNRSGPTGVAKLAFLREQLRFENLARNT